MKRQIKGRRSRQAIVDEPSYPGEGFPIPVRVVDATRFVEAEYVTRDMLASLRDEIESLLTRCEIELKRAHADAEQIKAIKASHYRIECALGMHHRPESDVHSEPVPWSYFHEWITRINLRLDDFERRITALTQRATS